MPGVDVTAFGLGVAQILKLVGGRTVTRSAETLGFLIEVFETCHRTDAMLAEGIVISGDGIVGLVQHTLIVGRRIAVPVPVVHTRQVVAVECFLLGVFVIPAATELQVQTFHQIEGESLGHGELVGIVVALLSVLIHQHVGILGAAYTNQPLTVRIGSAERRRHREHTAEIVSHIGTTHQAVPSVVREVDGGAGSEPRLDFIIAVEGPGETLVPVVGSIAFRIVEAQRRIVRTLIVTSLKVNRIVLAECRSVDVHVFEHEFLEDELVAIYGVGHGLPAFVEQERQVVRILHHTPVGGIHLVPIGGSAVGIEVDVTGTVGLHACQCTQVGSTITGCTLVGLAHPEDVVFRTEEVVIVVEVVETELGTHVDGTVPFLATLGGHENHTVGGTRTVDGGCTGILHHFHGFDVGGVDVGQRTLGTVHNHKRRT